MAIWRDFFLESVFYMLYIKKGSKQGLETLFDKSEFLGSSSWFEELNQSII